MTDNTIRKYPFDYSIASFDVNKNEFEYLTKQLLTRDTEEEEEYKRTGYRITISPRVTSLPSASTWGNDKKKACELWDNKIKNSLKSLFENECMDIICSSLTEIDENKEKIEIEGFLESRIRQIQLKSRIEKGKNRHSLHMHILVIIDHSTRVKILYEDIAPKFKSILDQCFEKNSYIHLKWLPNVGNFDSGISGAERYLMKKE